jgi:hypothetical protein
MMNFNADPASSRCVGHLGVGKILGEARGGFRKHLRIRVFWLDAPRELKWSR